MPRVKCLPPLVSFQVSEIVCERQSILEFEPGAMYIFTHKPKIKNSSDACSTHFTHCCELARTHAFNIVVRLHKEDYIVKTLIFEQRNLEGA